MTNKSIPGKGELPSNSSRPLTVSDLMRVLEDMFSKYIDTDHVTDVTDPVISI